jgi:hypothetical protein
MKRDAYDPREWRDVWEAGKSDAAIRAIEPVADIVRECREAARA